MGRKKKVKGGKLSRFVNTPEAMAVFRHVYEIPNNVGLRYVHWSDALNPATRDLLIPVVAIVEGGIRFPMDPLIVMGTVELNRRLGLELGIHDILRTYILHHNTKTEAYSLRPRDVDFTLVNGLSDTNRGFDEDYLIVSGEWFLLGHKCPTRDGVPDPRRRNPRKSLININSLREAWESELCTDDHAQPRSAPLLLRYVLRRNLIWPAETCFQPKAARALLRTCRPPLNRTQSKRARVESPAGPSRLASSTQPSPLASEAQGTVHVTQLGNVVLFWYASSVRRPIPRGGIRAIMGPANGIQGRRCGNGGGLPPPCQQCVECFSSQRTEGSKLSLELEDRFRANKDHLAHANVLATKVEAEESLHAALDSLTKAGDKVRALELELERAKKAAYESGSKEAQDEMGRQLPGVCNEYYMDAWNDAIAVLNSGQTMLPPNPIKLPFPGAAPPPHPETVLNSPPPQLGAVMVDLEEVESAEAVGPVDAGLQDAPDGGSTAPDEASPNNL
uniref:Uncharacterized protein n=1 Tax=Fagus sylvatica TaxID=28930 RepID=A0A2N9GWI1_FAGSY